MNQGEVAFRFLLALAVLVFGGGLLLAYNQAPKEWRWVVILVTLAVLAGGCCIVPYVVGVASHR